MAIIGHANGPSRRDPLFGRSRARAQSTATLRGVDVYRSKVLTSEEAHGRFDSRLREYVLLRNMRGPGSIAKAESLRREMEKETEASPASRGPNCTSRNISPPSITRCTRSSTLSTRQTPRASLRSGAERRRVRPAGLLAAWRKYVVAGEVVSQRGR